jgi:hypothetical protein
MKKGFSASNKTVFLGLFEVCGQYSALEKGLEKIGWNTIRVDVSDTLFEFAKPTAKNRLFAAWEMIWRLKSKEPKISIKKVIYKLVCETLAFFCVLYICLNCKAAIFGYGSKFFKGSWEFYLYKIFNVKTLFLFHGSDSEPPYLNVKFKDVDDDILVDMTQDFVRKLRQIEMHSDYTITAPTISQFLVKPFVNAHALGMQFDASAIDPVDCSVSSGHDDKRVCVAYCPSAPKLKGADEIRAVVNALKSEGLVFEYIETFGEETHENILKIISKVDLVIDAMNSNAPIGIVGLEAGFFGVPALVSGNAGDIFSAESVKHMPPSIYVGPDEFKEKLRELIMNEEYRRLEGSKAYDYCRNFLSNDSIAARYEKLIFGAVDSSWYLDPNDFSYCHGSLPSGEGLETMSRLANKYTFEALGLDERFRALVSQ